MYVDLFDEIEDKTGLPLKLFNTKEIEPCIVYEVSPVKDDGVVAVDSMNFRIIHFTARECNDVDKILKKVMLSVGDIVGSDIKKVAVSGGGFMPQDETNTVHKLTFYTITRKSEVV